jgi:hypothetical protein
VGDVIAWEATTAGDFWYVGVRAVRPVDAFPPRTLPNEPNAVRRLGLNAPGLIVYDDISLLHDGRGELTVR